MLCYVYVTLYDILCFVFVMLCYTCYTTCNVVLRYMTYYFMLCYITCYLMLCFCYVITCYVMFMLRYITCFVFVTLYNLLG